MLVWVCQQVMGLGGDLFELYCGNGNFMMVLVLLFECVFVIEVVSLLVKVVQYNLMVNEIDNVKVVCFVSENFSVVLVGSKIFCELEGVELCDYCFLMFFVDLLWVGFDVDIFVVVIDFEYILYIFCNL